MGEIQRFGLLIEKMGEYPTAMSGRETSQAIDAAAAEWAAREDKGALSDTESDALAAWLAGDSRCLGALMRARAVYMRTEAAQALGSGFDPDTFLVPEKKFHAQIQRRQRALYLSGAAAACVLMVAIAGSSLLAPEALATELGEVRLVSLEDGSSVVLNTQTRVKVRYSRDRRLVQLLEGEVDFRIVPDIGRDFVVSVGDSQIKATDASFRVRHINGARIEVLVYRGAVQVSGKTASPTGVTVETNTQLSLTAGKAVPDGGEKVSYVAPDEVKRALAWREGKLAFEGETLAAAAASFRRYSATTILIQDPDLAQETIVGLFAANDPVGFSKAIEEVFDAKAIKQDDKIILMRKE